MRDTQAAIVILNAPVQKRCAISFPLEAASETRGTNACLFPQPPPGAFKVSCTGHGDLKEDIHFYLFRQSQRMPGEKSGVKASPSLTSQPILEVMQPHFWQLVVLIMHYILDGGESLVQAIQGFL